MTFDIKHSNQSHKFLKKCDKVLAKRITSGIESLREEPRRHGAIQVESSEKLFRVRVGITESFMR